MGKKTEIRKNKTHQTNTRMGKKQTSEKSDTSENFNSKFWMAKQLQLKRLIRKSTVFELFLDFVQISNDLDQILTLLEKIFPPSALVIVDNPYLKWLDSGPVVFCGNGVEKAQNLLHHKHAIFEIQVQPSAANMVEVAHKQFIYNQLEDLAYFEPHYLKAFWSPAHESARNI
jgi:hypothetical protein